MKSLFFSLTYNVLTRLVLLVISMLSVKILSVNEYGELSYILVIASSLAIVSLFGGGVVVNRNYSIGRIDGSFELANKILYFNLLVSFIVSLVVLLVMLVFITDIKNLIYVYLLFFLMSINGIFEGALYGLGKYRDLGINSILTFLLSIFVSYILIMELKVFGALIALIVYRILMLLLNIRSIVKTKIIKRMNMIDVVNDKKIYRIFVNQSFPTFVGAVLVTPVMMILIFILKNTPDGIDHVAYFAWNNQVYTLAIFLPSVLSGYFISKISFEKDSARLKVMKYIKYNFIFGFGVVTSLFFLKTKILEWGGKEYVINGSEAYNYMLLAIIAYCLNSAYGSYWISIGKFQIGLFVNLIWATIVILLSFILIKVYMYTNEVIFISLFVGYIFIFILQLLFFFNKRKLFL